VADRRDLKFQQRCYKSAKKSVKRSLGRLGDFLVRQSSLPDQPVMDATEFPWAGMLEDNFSVIRDELDRVMAFRESIPKVYDVQREQYRISSDDKWKVFMLYGWGHVSRTGERMCPETARIVRKIPGVRSAFFSILDAGAHIPDHRGHVKGLLRGQLAIRVPEQSEACFLRVEDLICHWQEGRLLVFDDTYRHEVQNNSDQERVVLLLHFDRPMNRLGRTVNACLMSVIKRTPFVRKAVRNHAEWEDRFRRQLAAAGVAMP
jgi:aspartyl/asparaginyl beta-hydroxylase (cupin superfamily)